MVLLIAVQGCAGSAAISHGHVPSATVDVGIVYAGGPAPQAGAPLYLRPGTVTLKRQRGPSYTVAVVDGRRTRAVVEPGPYTVDAQSGDAQCLASHLQISRAQTGQAAEVTVTCSVK